MTTKRMLRVTLTKEPEGGYSVLCNDLDVASQGESVDEALANIKEAVELYIESAHELGMMDEVLEKLGLTPHDLKKAELPPVLRTEIPVELELSVG